MRKVSQKIIDGLPDLMQVKWGRLTIIGEYEPADKSKGIKFATILCKCDCGTLKRIIFHNVVDGKVLSCGCFDRELKSKRGKTLAKILGLKSRKFSVIQSIAKDVYSKTMKRHPGNLTFEDFYNLSQLPCFYCGSGPINKHHKYGSRNSEYTDGYAFIYNGLDRIDNALNYDLDNVVPCCKWCNYMKNSQSTSELFERIVNIILNHKEEFSKLGISLDK